eukprot:Pgem_evm1s19290
MLASKSPINLEVAWVAQNTWLILYALFFLIAKKYYKFKNKIFCHIMITVSGIISFIWSIGVIIAPLIHYRTQHLFTMYTFSLPFSSAVMWGMTMLMSAYIAELFIKMETISFTLFVHHSGTVVMMLFAFYLAKQIEDISLPTFVVMAELGFIITLNAFLDMSSRWIWVYYHYKKEKQPQTVAKVMLYVFYYQLSVKIVFHSLWVAVYIIQESKLEGFVKFTLPVFVFLFALVEYYDSY